MAHRTRAAPPRRPGGKHARGGWRVRRLDVEHRELVDQQANSIIEIPAARILVAEDHTDSRDALQALLEAHGYVVTIAVDGREAIERAQSVRPDLILMDIMMPVVDGLSATRALRGKSELDATPIIALTAMEGGRERALEAGCDDHIPKPIDLPSLFQKVRWWVEHRRVASSGGAAGGGRS